MSTLSDIKNPHQISRTDSFIELSEKLCLLMKEEEVFVRPYSNKDQLHFSKLPELTQISQLHYFQKYVEVCQETREESHSLKESRFLMWNMMRKLGLTPPSDLFNQISENQIFEIYNQSNVQIFRNLQFFKICSYSLDDLLSIPWWKLYRRDEHISQELFKFGSAIMSGETKKPIFPKLDAHLLEEIASESKYKMLLEVKLMSPLSDSSDALYCFVAEEAQMINH